MPFHNPSILPLPLTYIHSTLAYDGTFTKLPALPQHIAIMPSDSTTTSSNSRIGATEQPYSRLHALPPEIRDLIYAFAVVSPDHIPAGIAARKIKVVPGPPAAEGGGGGRSQQQKKHPLLAPGTRGPQNPTILPHPPLPTSPLLHRPSDPHRSPPDLLQAQYFPLPRHASDPRSGMSLAASHGAR